MAAHRIRKKPYGHAVVLQCVKELVGLRNRHAKIALCSEERISVGVLIFAA